METCLMVVVMMLGSIWGAYRIEKKRWAKLYFDCNESRGKAWEDAARFNGEKAVAEHRLERCRAELKKLRWKLAASRGRVTRLMKKLSALEGGAE